MKNYLDLLKYVLENGEDQDNRTGIPTRSVFGPHLRFNLKAGFPAVTTKKLAWKAVVSELLWFLEGSTDERRLCEIQHGTRDPEKKTIWTENADNQGVSLGYRNDDQKKELGPIYGKQWRDFNGVDQISNLIEGLKNNPQSRRHIVSAWNPQDIEAMALPPCHTLFQFKVTNQGLSCLLYQRSADLPLGTPFNVASYALLTHIIAEICDMEVDKFVYDLGDAHIYHNQFDAVRKQTERLPSNPPQLQLPNLNSLDDVFKTSINDYQLLNYSHRGAIEIPFAV